ncbi:pectate lyase-like adhesive domain-containing protein [Raoultibacter phocaeensis]|uniref:pectate lyase-like adhesive domain-containing protein n=1 Tax=Raoultibacter phocaeensis TaxID=2479841 RepID=UPI00111B7BDE|nr:pectate lyase-like adhesive domain-containing protein [Raoultibacter phocaeensis]
MSTVRNHMQRALGLALAVFLLVGLCAPSFGFALPAHEAVDGKTEGPSSTQSDELGRSPETDRENESESISDSTEPAPSDTADEGGADNGPSVSGIPNETDITASNAAEAAIREEAKEDLKASRTSSLVASFEDLAQAIAAPDIDTITLGGDIVMTSGISIPSTKQSLTIDGQGRYSLEQQHSGAWITSSSTAQAVYTLKDMTIIGRSYYGVIASSATSGAPTIVFDSVSYSGPQLIYNRYGNALFTGESTVSIRKNGSTSNNAEEVGEVHGVTIASTVQVESTSVGSSFFWMFGAASEKPYLTVENGAQATFRTSVNMSARGFFWVEGTTYNVVLSVGDGASLLVDITGYNPLSTAEDHRVDSIYIGKSASATFNFAGGIALSNSLVVDEGATLRMNYLSKPGTNESAYAYPLFRFLKASGGAPVVQVNRAKAVVFSVQPANRPIFGLANANTLQFATTDFNYWTTYTSAASQEKPARMWSSEADNGFTATLNLNAGQDDMGSIVSNQSGFADEFELKKARVIQVGTEPIALIPDEYWASMSSASGTTAPEANVYIDYTGTDASAQSFSGASDQDGRYSVAIETSAVDASTVLSVTAVRDFVALRRYSAVREPATPAADGVLQVIEQGSVFPTDALSLITNVEIGDEGPLEASIASIPDTGTVGPTHATVLIANASGKSAQITVPVFITDASTTVDTERLVALRAEDFSLYANEFPSENAQEFVLERSRARAWNMLSGEDISSRIAMPDNPLSETQQTQSVMLAVEGVERSIIVTILDDSAWVNVRIPTKMLFGTLDAYENGTVISPRYEIENGSDLPLAVSLAEFTVLETDGITLLSGPDAPADESALKLSLDVDGTTAVEYLHPFNGNDSHEIPLTTLGSAQRNYLTLSGTYYGAFQPETVYRPTYSLVWSFAPVT